MKTRKHNEPGLTGSADVAGGLLQCGKERKK